MPLERDNWQSNFLTVVSTLLMVLGAIFGTWILLSLEHIGTFWKEYFIRFTLFFILGGIFISFILHIRKANTIPILAPTANAMQEEVNEYLTAAFDKHLAKPLLDYSIFPNLF